MPLLRHCCRRPASAQVEQVFPHVRAGTGRQPTSGGGFVAGDRYVARTAAVAWSRKTNDLILTTFRNPKVPTRIAGLREGARLTFTRVDSYPGGV